MRKFATVLLSASLLVTGLLVFSEAAEQPQPTPTKDFAVLSTSGDLFGEARAPAAARQVNPPEKPPNGTAAKGDARIRPGPDRMHVRLEILANGKPLRTIQHAGKTYLPVPRVGMEYEIRVWNHGPHRITAVLSVDGLSVISGQPASESHPGYIVAPYNHIRIKGWRRSLETVAAFAFVEREKSYAALTWRPENIGVIGLVAIEEFVWTSRPGLEKVGPVGAAKRAHAQVGNIGTEYGPEIDSRVYYVPFVRSANKRTITFYYDTVHALREAGVPVDGPFPVPFPKDSEFAQPPAGYKAKR